MGNQIGTTKNSHMKYAQMRFGRRFGMAATAMPPIRTEIPPAMPSGQGEILISSMVIAATKIRL